MKVKRQNEFRMIWCPGCKSIHSMPVESFDGREIWGYNDNDDSPTFSPSIKVTQYDWEDMNKINNLCHSFVREGKIQFLSDCTHELKGQTVELPDWPFKD